MLLNISTNPISNSQNTSPKIFPMIYRICSISSFIEKTLIDEFNDDS